MKNNLEIQMRDFGRIESLDIGAQEINFGDICIVKSDYGLDYGKVVATSDHSKFRVQISNEVPVYHLIRQATPADLEQIEKNRILAKDTLTPCRERIALHRLPIRVLSGEYSFDRHKLVFYFTAADRIDFRALVRDLATLFKARIDLHQIGARDEAKVIGGIAPCGKAEICCTQFMTHFDTITTKMAKVQRLPVHQEKLLGLCGQLKCCLKFELETYEELSKTMPDDGSYVVTKLGKGCILSGDILRQTVTVRLEDERHAQCPVSEITLMEKEDDKRKR